jgi:hypothetical protein
MTCTDFLVATMRTYHTKFRKKSNHFNKHLEHYTSMKLIFRNSTTTKKFANGSNNDAYLEIEAIEEEGYNVPTTH